MKIDYNIIWVEDKIETKPFISIKKKIEKFLENEFFNVSISTAEDLDEFKDEYQKKSSFDLIITDLNLNESHGYEVIDFVRDEKHIFTEIFFYSANSELSDTQLANNSRITFHQMDEASSYRDLENAIVSLIKLTISKFQHIVSMRGMIMHETSILDEQTYEMVSKYITNNEDSVRNDLFDELISFFKRKFELSSKSKKNNNINNILKDPVLLSSTQRANVLSSIIEIKGFSNFIDDFKNEVITVRNQFAHAVLKEKEDGTQYFENKKDGIEFNSEYCKKIRRDLIRHKESLDNLKTNLNE